MRLVIDDKQITGLVPNIVAPVKGERSLIEKLAMYIDASEKWLIDRICSEAVFDRITDYQCGHLHAVAVRAVVADTMLNALPVLDVVMTPNGFAVVGTQNLTPASRPRMDAVMHTMSVMRDEAISELLQELYQMSDWIGSEQGKWFGATLCPDFDITNMVVSGEGSRWERYQQLRSELITIEARLAEEWMSEEQMDALRFQNLHRVLSTIQKRVVMRLQSIEAAVLRGEKINETAMRDIVNIMRMEPWAFPEWHLSATAKLFNPPVFKNDKKSAGYFF